MNVKIIPKNKRSKERISQHGEIMKLCETQKNKFLVESLNKTWSGQHWKGWFTDQEASFELLKKEG